MTITDQELEVVGTPHTQVDQLETLEITSTTICHASNVNQAQVTQ